MRAEWVERSRRCVFGYLCPMILHETNNVLTVMSGIRQLLGQGRSLSDRIGPMLDSQLEKMDQLLGWIHGLSSDEVGTATRTLEDLTANIDNLISLAAKGRRLQLTREGSDDAIPGAAFEVLALGTLCGVLPLIPPNAPGARLEARIEATRVEAGYQIRAVVDPSAVEPSDAPDIRLGASLVRSWGGTFSCDRTPEGRGTVELALPEA